MIDTEQNERYSNNLFEKRILDALLEKKRILDELLEEKRILDNLLEEKRHELLAKSNEEENEKRFLDKLLEKKRYESLYNSEEADNEQERRHILNNLNNDDGYEVTHNRRKLVGLGDDPYKRR